MITPRIATFVLLVVLAIDVQAQVSARQGTQDEAAPKQFPSSHEFRSPMILEISFPPADKSAWGKETTHPENLNVYSCDTVHLRNLRFKVSREKAGKVDVEIKYVLFTEPGHDRVADLTFDLLRDGEMITRPIYQADIDAEEGKLAIGKARLTLATDKLTAQPPPILRITMSVKEN